MWAMEKLKYCLLGRQFVSRVDHKPLVAMHEGKMNSILENWMFTILRFDFTNSYLLGPQNWFADAFSRMYEGHDVYVGAKQGATSGQPHISATDVEVAIQLEAEKRGKTVPTQDLRAGIIVKYHALGHLGTENIFRKIWSADFWWPNM